MRPIKFRIFSKGTSSNPNFNKFGQMFDINQLIVQKYYPGTSIFDKEDFVIQQFTGLKDIDGVEIYEGDIVEWKGFYSNFLLHREPVIFRHGVFWADLPLYEVNKVCKIVGNIFEDKFVPEVTKKNEARK